MKGMLLENSSFNKNKQVILDKPSEKPRLLQDVFERESNTFEKECDSILPLNRKQITNINSSLAKKTKDQQEDEFLGSISYLLNQQYNSLPWDPSAEEQPFFQEILFRNKKQISHVLFLNQSLNDIKRFCTNTLAPTSFCSLLAADATYNIGAHYVTQTTYRNLSIFKVLLQKHMVTQVMFLVGNMYSKTFKKS